MVYLIGRLTEDPVVKQTETNEMLPINLAVQRAYKNEDGIYETDYIRCVLWSAMATNTCEYCKKGDILGVKGRLQSNSYEKEDKKVYVTDIIAEKVTFLTTKKAGD
jgi:single-strand DNA-binding protein